MKMNVMKGHGNGLKHASKSAMDHKKIHASGNTTQSKGEKGMGKPVQGKNKY